MPLTTTMLRLIPYSEAGLPLLLLSPNLLKNILSYPKGRVRGRERLILPLVHFPSGSHNQAWSKLKPWARKSIILVSICGWQGPECLSHLPWPSQACAQRPGQERSSQDSNWCSAMGYRRGQNLAHCTMILFPRRIFDHGIYSGVSILLTLLFKSVFSDSLFIFNRPISANGLKSSSDVASL